MTDALGSALDHLRLDGALFFRSELTEPFEFESTPLALADALVPGADRLTLFHIVASGSCWVAVDDGVRYWADEGDVIVMPYADHYAMGGEGAAECVSILSLLDPLPWAEMPVLRHGGGGAAYRDRLRLHALDRSAVRPGDAGAAAGVRRPPVERSRRSSGSARASTTRSPTRCRRRTCRRARSRPGLPELVLIEVLRAHLATAPAIDHGWIAALRDPILAPALAALHQDPVRRWTVAALAVTSAPPVRRSTTASGRSSDSHRSATSPPGACTSPPTCSRRPSCRCSRSPGASATTPRRRSAGRSSASAASSPSHWRAATRRQRRQVTDDASL